MKQIKWLITGALIASLAFTACDSGQKAKKQKQEKEKDQVELNQEKKTIGFDTLESVVQWTGTMVGVYEHSGTLKFNNAVIVVQNGKIQNGRFIVDLTTMTPTDDNYNPKEGSTKDKLVQHLTSPDFFNVEEYTEAWFEIRKHTGTSITGILSIRDKKHTETVENVKIKEVNGELEIHGELTFNRHNYNVDWEHPKDKVLSEDIELKIILKE